MTKQILFLLLISINFYGQTPRAGGINNSQATVQFSVHPNFTGVQPTNNNAFAVYDFATNFDYYLGLKSTDNIAEGSTNKYFSNTLARNAFSAGSGLVYSAGNYSLDSSTLGILASVANKLNIPTGTSLQYLNGLGSPVVFPTVPTDNNQLTNGSGYITASSSNTLTNKSGNISQWTNNSGYLTSYTESDPLFDTKFSTKTTSNLTEGTNLYYTGARFNSSFLSKTTTDLSEGTNQYFTNSRARNSISAGNELTYNSTTGVISKTKNSETLTGTTNASGLVTFSFTKIYGAIPNIQYQFGFGANVKETVIFNAAPTTTGAVFLVQIRNDVLGLLPTYSNVSGREVNILVTEK